MTTSQTTINKINLTNVIGKAFYPVHKDIKAGGHTYYDLYGGRGSLKSTFASVEIVLGIMRDAAAGNYTNAVVFHKYSIMLRDSVFAQIEWAIDALGANEEWRGSVSPLQFVYTKTGQKIIFRGLDKSQKTKSIKASKGYFKYLWFEELDIFNGESEVRMAEQSVLRGGEHYICFKTFNPPINRSNWANEYVDKPNPNAYRHKSNYLDVNPEWLGSEFIEIAEHLKQVNPRAYEHEYLGVPVGLGTNVFENLEFRKITDEEISHFDRIYQGADWGFFPDPFAFVRTYYDRKSETIYFIDEIGANRWSNARSAEEILKRKYDDYEVTCDSAEPKSINDFRDMGIMARGAVKGAGSVEYGMKWLQTKKIVFDWDRTPKAAKEFKYYEFEIDRTGEVIPAYPDKDNHFIDATRYAYERLASRRGNTA